MNLAVRIVILLACSVLFSECSAPEGPDPAAIAGDGQLIAKVGGTAYVSTVAAAAVAGGTITITANDASGKIITISLLSSATTGAHEVRGSAGVPEAAIVLSPDGEEAYASSYFSEGTLVGMVIITEINTAAKTISGTFLGEVKRFVPEETVVQITEGSFTKIPYTANTAANNTFSLKKDGSALTGFTAITAGYLDGTYLISFHNPTTTASVSLTFAAGATAGVHELSGLGSDYAATYTENSGSSVWTATTGTINITKLDTTSKRIEATFSFDADRFTGESNPISFTEGSFAATWLP